MKARCSSCHWVVSRVITDGDNPAEVPKNSASAGAKSPVDRPCRYSSGSTSATFGLLRAHRGTIELRNFALAPVSGSTRRSSTRGARTSTAPAEVVIVRDRACPLRTTNRRPSPFSKAPEDRGADVNEIVAYNFRAARELRGWTQEERRDGSRGCSGSGSHRRASRPSSAPTRATGDANSTPTS